jgi:hypothetical protein
MDIGPPNMSMNEHVSTQRAATGYTVRYIVYSLLALPSGLSPWVARKLTPLSLPLQETEIITHDP